MAAPLLAMLLLSATKESLFAMLRPAHLFQHLFLLSGVSVLGAGLSSALLNCCETIEPDVFLDYPLFVILLVAVLTGSLYGLLASAAGRKDPAFLHLAKQPSPRKTVQRFQAFARAEMGVWEG